MTIYSGDVAPVFSLPDAQGNVVSLADFRGRRVVLYFYPRDNTPGCTKEACGFRDIHSDYESRNIAVPSASAQTGPSLTPSLQLNINCPFPCCATLTPKLLPPTAVTDSKNLWEKNLWELLDRLSRSTQMVGLKRFIGKSNQKLTRRKS